MSTSHRVPPPPLSPEVAAQLRQDLKREVVDRIVKPAAAQALEHAVNHVAQNPDGPVGQLLQQVDAGTGGVVTRLVELFGRVLPAQAPPPPPITVREVKQK